MTQKWDAIVVGGGLAGSTAAAYLAVNGKRVLLLEHWDVLGGSSHAFRRRGRWEFDVGVHYIENAGPDGLMPLVLSGLGLKDRIDFLPLDADGHNRIVGPDFELKVPHGWDRYLENLLAAFPGEKRAIRRYVSLMRAAGSGLDRFDVSYSALAAQLRRSGIAAPFYLAPFPVVAAACGLSARALMVLTTEVADYAASPQNVTFGFHAGFMDQFISGGAWFPRGGGQVLSANLAEVIRAHGGTIRTGATVEKIIVDKRKVTGVRLDDGEVIDSSLVVSAADLKRTLLELVGPEHLPATHVVRTKALSMSWPFFNTFFGVELDLRTAANANHFVIPNWDATSNLLSAAKLLPKTVELAHFRDRDKWIDDFAANMPAFVQSSTTRDPGNSRSAPAGSGAVEAMTLSPHSRALWGVAALNFQDRRYRGESVYRDIKARLTDAMLDRVETAYPGARAAVRWSEAATPATQMRYTRSTQGTTFGLEPSLTQFGPMRPGTKTPIKGLLLAGTSTRWGPGTTGSMISGMQAAAAALGRDLVREVRDGAVFADTSLLPVHGPEWDPIRVARQSDVELVDDADPIAVRNGV